MATIATASDQAQPWQYTALPSKSSFRIIHLLPAKDRNDPLECQLVEENLESNPEYSAISYVWGDESNPSRILCGNGTYLSITRSLDATLRRFRKEDKEMRLWADAICINQQDFLERHRQVHLMGDIYRTAAQVLVWLGEEDEYEDTMAAVDCIFLLGNTLYTKMFQYIDQHGMVEDESGKRTVAKDFKPAMTKVFKPDDFPDFEKDKKAQLDALQDFFLKRPWFERAWTFQETYLARKKSYYCGCVELPGDSMDAVVTALIVLLEQKNDDRFSFWQHSHFKSMIILPREQPMDGIDLSQLLMARRGTKCKNPSDLIYSLIGLTTDYWKSAITPDYRKPFQTTFAELAVQLIDRLGNLNILSLINIDSTSSQDLPSWVPDWRMNRSRDSCIQFCSGLSGTPKGLDYSWYRASGSSKPQFLLSPDAKHLMIHGILLDTISRKSPDSVLIGHWDWAQQCLENGTFPSTYIFTGETINDALIRTVNGDYSNQTGRFDSESLTSLKNITTADFLTHFNVNLDPIGLEKQCCFLDAALIFNGKLGSAATKPMIMRLPEEDNGLQFSFNHNCVGDKNAFLMCTKRGILGMTNPNARPGDIIVVPLGGAVPIVLRPSGDRFLFVSECYCHGFMDGEAFVEERRNADRSWDGQDRSWLERDDLIFYRY